MEEQEKSPGSAIPDRDRESVKPQEGESKWRKMNIMSSPIHPAEGGM